MSAKRIGVKHVCQILAIYDPALEDRRLLERPVGHWFIGPEAYKH